MPDVYIRCRTTRRIWTCSLFFFYLPFFIYKLIRRRKSRSSLDKYCLDAFAETRRSRWRRRRRSRRSSIPDCAGRPPSPSTARDPSPRPASSARIRPSRYSSGVLDCKSWKRSAVSGWKVFSKNKNKEMKKQETKRRTRRAGIIVRTFASPFTGGRGI